MRNRNLTNRTFRATLLIACAVMAAGPAAADTLEMRDGSLLQGKYVGGSQSTIRIDVQGKVEVIPIADVLALTFDARPTPAAGEAPPPAAAPQTTPAASAQAAPAAGSAAAPINIPAGTPLLINMKQAVNSKYNHAGYRFKAVLETPLQVAGKAVAPEGSEVYGQLVETKSGGRLVKRAELSLVLTDIVIGGLRHPITTGQYEVKGESQGTGRKVARGAALGALIDGKKGAKTGAKVGVGAAILTRGNQVNVPAGTILEFRLVSPVSVGGQ